MSNSQEPLWPFGTRNALLATVVIWFAVGIFLVAARTYIGWPDETSVRLAALIVLGLGLVPVALMLLDFAASRRAVLDIKGVKIDFSGVDLARAEVRQETAGIPDNIGVSGPIVSDTTPMNIIATLEEATRSEIVVADLKEGHAWWVTRLLALAAGAVRAGSPNAIVFIGKRSGRDHQFLGWAEPKEVVEGILRAKDDYKERYIKAMRIAKQVVMYGANEFVPTNADPFVLHSEVQRYTNSSEYAKLGDAVAEQILMDQLATVSGGASLEAPPDRLTLGRLTDLLEHCLHKDKIDLESPKDKQVLSLLDAFGSYVALVREGRYDSMIKKEDGERLLLKELFSRSQEAA
jgi:hypothetical protein